MRQKTREFQSAMMDSTVWNDFAFRDGDVVIASWAKSGTTWLQQIATQLIFRAAEDVAINKMSPWYDARITPPEVRAEVARQEHRRILKTHQPTYALPLSPKAHFIYVARDGRDAVWSLYNHFINLFQPVYDMFNNTPGRVGPPVKRPEGTELDFFRDWMRGEGPPLSPFFENVRGWWDIGNDSNIKLVHFNDLKADLTGEMRAIATFLGVELAPAEFSNAVNHCSFEYMKSHAERMAPRGGVSFSGGAGTFIHKGINGRWRDDLPDDESRAYEEMARRELGEECAHWLAHGSRS